MHGRWHPHDVLFCPGCQYEVGYSFQSNGPPYDVEQRWTCPKCGVATSALDCYRLPTGQLLGGVSDEEFRRIGEQYTDTRRPGACPEWWARIAELRRRALEAGRQTA